MGIEVRRRGGRFTGRLAPDSINEPAFENASAEAQVTCSIRIVRARLRGLAAQA